MSLNLRHIKPNHTIIYEETYALSQPTTTTIVSKEIIQNDEKKRPMISIERFAFYDFAKTSYAVIQTGERRFYGCFMLRKGVVPPEK